jgi:hypothetical protein
MVREYGYVYGAVCPWDGESFSLILPQANTPSMELFLQEFSNYYRDYRVVMVMDQASWHRAGSLEGFDNICIIHQPAHSPEVNPVEHLWEYFRENYFHNHGYNSLDELAETLVQALVSLSNDKSTVQSLTGFHWTIFNV